MRVVRRRRSAASRVSLVRRVSEVDFPSLVLGSSQPVLVHVYADWSTSSRLMAPLVGRIAREYYRRLMAAKLDVNRHPRVALRYGVRSLPTLLFFSGGELVDTLVGFPGPVAIRNWAADLMRQVAEGEQARRPPSPAA
jgi:thioredoxin